MAKFYSNKELSDLLKINIAKWKRWSREFLPPDPLGGLQSGFARQYSTREAFIVALGGHLVSFLKYTIPETRIILADIDQWLENSGYYSFNAKVMSESNSSFRGMNRHQLYICTHAVGKGDRAGFAYAIEEIIMIETLARDSQSERRIHVKAEFIDAPHESREQLLESEFVKLLNLGPFYSKFKEALRV